MQHVLPRTAVAVLLLGAAATALGSGLAAAVLSPPVIEAPSTAYPGQRITIKVTSDFPGIFVEIRDGFGNVLFNSAELAGEEVEDPPGTWHFDFEWDIPEDAVGPLTVRALNSSSAESTHVIELW